MKDTFYIYNNGTLKRKDNTLQFVNENNEKRDIPIERISDIYVMGELNLNTAMLNFISKYGITMHFFNYYSFYTGSYYPKEQLLSGSLLVKQVEYYTDNEKRLNLAKKIIEAAADNIYRNLRYYNSRGKDLQGFMDEIDNLKKQIPKCNSVNELMGYEGNIRKVYYSSWNIIIDQNIEFVKRVKNPPDNMINTLISFVNTLIYTRTLSEIYNTQLNPTISYLHEPGERRFSLCLDISEIFKPLIGDRLIFSLLNKKQITEKSFTKSLNYLHLTKEASQKIMATLDEKLKTTITHKDLNKKVSYEYLIRLECYKLVKHLLDEKEYSGFKIWW
jgi:CRISP-associated protein Cas1